jgi:hypothetical protein
MKIVAPVLETHECDVPIEEWLLELRYDGTVERMTCPRHLEHAWHFRQLEFDSKEEYEEWLNEETA